VLIGADALPENDTRVLFVSFMRDFAFWKENSRRLVRVFIVLNFHILFPQFQISRIFDAESNSLKVQVRRALILISWL
jgi:hypothetical protein